TLRRFSSNGRARAPQLASTRKDSRMNCSIPARRSRVAMLVSIGMVAAVPAFAAAPAWQPDVFYAAGMMVSYLGNDYSSLVNQTDYSSTGWNPTVGTLWSLVGPDSGGGSTSGGSGSGGGTGGGSTGGTSGGASSGGGTSSSTGAGSGGTCATAWSAAQVY